MLNLTWKKILTQLKFWQEMVQPSIHTLDMSCQIWHLSLEMLFFSSREHKHILITQQIQRKQKPSLYNARKQKSKYKRKNPALVSEPAYLLVSLSGKIMICIKLKPSPIAVVTAMMPWLLSLRTRDSAPKVDRSQESQT